MSEEVRIWQVGTGETLTEIRRSALELEQRIEKWILSDVSVLSPDLLIIGEQVATAYGKFIDLLCIDSSGNLVIVELKRDKTPREVTAQALDYASWVKDLTIEKIEAIAAKHLKTESLEVAFQSKFQTDFPEAVNEHHAMLIVASEIDDSTERIIRYLSETHGVDINAVRFQFFQSPDGRELLVRTFTVAPQEVITNMNKGRSKRTFLSVEELAKQAADIGVGQLFEMCIERFSPYLTQKRRKAVCAFGIKLPDDANPKVVLSLVPGESSAEKGLRYRLYSKRLSEYLGVDQETIQRYLPPDPEPFQHYENAPAALRGWAGYIKNDEDIDKLVELMKLGSSQKGFAGTAG
jgi:hypothetical protein